MNFLVCSKLSIPAVNRTIPDWDALRALGYQVVLKHPDQVVPGEQPDVIVVMGVSVMEEGFRAIRRWPGVPLMCYQWDTYKWVWENPRPGEYDYSRWGELLKQATEIWVPSRCTGFRVHEWWNLYNWHVILSSCPYWDCPADDIGDDGYLLCTLRKIPDPWCDEFERACEAEGIPYRRPDHGLDYAEYQRTVARCRGIVSHYYEASTGGLTLLEGYYHGKPCLLSDSSWHGGRDYMQGRARYFSYGNFDDFRRELRWLYEDPLQLDRIECRAWVEANFSDARMARDMLARVNHHLGGGHANS